MNELNYKINQAPVAEEDKPRAAETSGETFTSTPAKEKEIEE